MQRSGVPNGLVVEHGGTLDGVGEHQEAHFPRTVV